MKEYDKDQIESAMRIDFDAWNERMLKELLGVAYRECQLLQSRLEELNQKVEELEKGAVRNYLEAMPVAFIHFPPKKADLARVDFCPKAKTKEIGSGWITVPLYKERAMQADKSIFYKLNHFK